MPTTGKFRERFIAALEKRLRTKGDYKLLAHRIGRSDDTISNWLHRKTRVPGEDFFALYRYFHSIGDTEFVAEVFGPETDLRLGDEAYWIAEDGTISAAPYGLAAFARHALGLDFAAGDAAGYAMRTLGWIAVLRDSAGRIEMRYALPHVAAQAVERAHRWIADNARFISVFRLTTLQNGDRVEREFHSLPAAHEALRHSIDLTRVPSNMSMTIEAQRLPIEAIVDQARRAALNAWNGPETDAAAILRILRTHGMTDSIAVIEIDGDDILLRELGSGLHVDNKMRGKNILTHGDANYGRIMYQQMMEIRQSGSPAYHDIRVRAEIDGGSYNRLAIPVVENGGARRLIISAVRVYAPPSQSRIA